jgi:hypothetical protein
LNKTAILSELNEYLSLIRNHLDFDFLVNEDYLYERFFEFEKKILQHFNFAVSPYTVMYLYNQALLCIYRGHHGECLYGRLVSKSKIQAAEGKSKKCLSTLKC